MPRRTLLSLALLAASLVLVGLLPGHPALREPLVQRVLSSTDGLGITVRHERSAGNLWRGVELEGVSVQGDGVDLGARRLSLQWFLPGLVTGELPLRLSVDALEGELDVARALAPRPAPPQPRRGLPLPQLRWQEVTLAGADVSLAGVPFTLPDGRIDEVEVLGRGDDLRLAARLTTREGSARLLGHADAASGTFEVEVQGADARIVRQWWDGVRAGVVTGQVHIGASGVSAEGWVEDGEIEAYGTEVVDIEGPVRWDGTHVHAELRGTALGGEVSARGVVDVYAQRWSVSGSAEALLPELTPVLWGLGAAGSPPATSGSATAHFTAAGWTDVALQVDGLVDGSVWGAEAESLATTVRYGGSGVEVRSEGSLAGGRLALEVIARAGDVLVDVELEHALWGPLLIDDLSGRLQLGAAPAGAARLRGSLQQAEGLPLVADLTLDDDGAALFLDAGTVDGPRLRGAAVAERLAGDAELTGSLQLLLPDELWHRSPPQVTLTLDGSVGRPAAELRVSGAEPALVRIGGAALDLDLRGSLEVALAEDGVDVRGALGAAVVRGGLGGGRTLELDTPAARVDGPVALELPALGLRLAADEAGWTLREAENRLALGAANGDWRATVRELAVRAAGEPLVVSAEAERPEGESWRGEAQITAALSALGQGALRVSARLDGDGTLDAEARIEAGSELGPLRPTVDLIASASVGLAAGSGSGSVVAGPLRLDASWAGGALEAQLGDGGEQLDLAWSPSSWSLDGSLALASLTPLLGLEDAFHGRFSAALEGDSLAGVFQVGAEVAAALGAGALGTGALGAAALDAGASVTDAGQAGAVGATVPRAETDAQEALVSVPRGEAQLLLDAPFAAVAGLSGDGSSVTVSLHADLGGERLELSGTIAPELTLQAQYGPLGPLRLDGAGGAGAGVLPAFDVGPLRVPEASWQAQLEPAASSAELTLGNSRLELTWHDGLAATLQLDQPLEINDQRAHLQGHANWHANDPDGSLQLTLRTADGHPLAHLDGDLRHAQLSGEAPTHSWTGLFSNAAHPHGTLTLNGHLAALDAHAQIHANWTLPDTTLEAHATLEHGTLNWHATAPGLDAHGTTERWHLTLDDFQPHPYLSTTEPQLDEALADAHLTGTLGHDPDGWLGELDLHLTTPLELHARIHGDGPTLTINGTATPPTDALEAHFTGHWRDTLTLDLHATTTDSAPPQLGDARLDGRLTLDPHGWTITGDLTTSTGHAGPLHWPAITLHWTLDPNGLTLHGDGGHWTTDGQHRSGRWQHPIHLAGEPHLLRLDDDHHPLLTLTGPTLTLTADPGERWQLDLHTPTPTTLLHALAPDTSTLTDLDAGPLHATATITPTAPWDFELHATTNLTLEGTTLPLHLQAHGNTTNASGDLTLGPNPTTPWAHAHLTLDQHTLHTHLDLATIDIPALANLTDLPLTGTLTGDATLDLSDTTSYTLDAHGDLTLAGHPLTLHATAGTQPWHLTLNHTTDTGPWQLQLHQSPTTDNHDATIELQGPTTNLQGTLTTSTTTPQAHLHGTLADHPTTLTLQGTPRDAHLHLTWNHTTLDASYQHHQLHATIDTTNTLPASPWHATAHLDTTQPHNPLHLTLTNPDLTLDLTGTTTPTNLHGTLHWNDQARALALHGPSDADAAWRLVFDEALALSYRAGELRLDGEAALALGELSVNLESELDWDGARGFGGRGLLTLEGLPGEGRLEAELRGDGPLELALEAALFGSAAGGAVGRLAADPRDGWQVELDLDVPLGGAGHDTARLAVAGRASGTPLAPHIDASLALSGPLAAYGRMWLDGSTLRADLAGPQVSASARWDEAGGRAHVRLSEADVGAWVPWLESPLLSGVVDARITPEGPQALADDLRLKLPAGSLSGRARLGPDGVLDVTARADLDLADLASTPAASGRLTGPVTLRMQLDHGAAAGAAAAPGAIAGTDAAGSAAPEGAALAGVLVLTEGRLEGVTGRLDGDVQVTGPAANPAVSLLLRASDGAEGSLRAGLRPRDRIGEIDADLRVADLHLALRGRLDGSELRADGRIELGEGLAFGVRSTDAGIVIEHEDDRQSLRLQLTPDPWRLRLDADLARVGDALGGSASAELDWRDGLWPSLEGSLRGLALGPVELGDWRLTGEGGQQAAYRAEGEHGSLELALPGLAWRAELAALPIALPGAAAALELELHGRGASAELAAALRGELDGRPLALQFAGDLDLGAGSGRLEAGGTLLGGTLQGAVERPAAAAWGGSLRLAGASFGERPLGLELSAQGDGPLPTLAADAVLGDELALTLAFDGEALSLRGAYTPLSYTPLADSPPGTAPPAAALLTLDGRVWPELDLVASGADAGASGQLRLRGAWDDAERPLRADGDLRLALGPLQLGVQGSESGRVRLRATSPLIDDGWLEQTLAADSVGASLAQLARDGLLLEGRGALQGSLALAAGEAGPELAARGLRGSVAGIGVRVDADMIGWSALEARVDADLRGLDVASGYLPAGLTLQAPVAARVTLADDRLLVEVGAPWELTLEADLAQGTGRLRTDLAWSSAHGPSALSGELGFDPSLGLSGQLEVDGIRFAAGEAVALLLEGSVTGAGGGVVSDLALRGARSAVSLRGRSPLPAALAQLLAADVPPLARELDLRLAALAARDLPWLRSALPHLDGTLSGSVAVRGEQAVGQLVAGDLRLAERALPLVATVAADLGRRSADVRLEAVGSSATVSWRDGRLEGLARLERFPLHALAEAMVGPSDVSAEVTGAVRAGWEPGDGSALDLRVATELVRLEREGIVTLGQVAFELADGALRIQQASFEGSGAWRATGEIRPERIDLEVVAEEADFSPLLGLVPDLARYGVGAAGDLRLIGRGTLAQPVLALEGRNLRLDVAGTSYELLEAEAHLDGEELSLRAEVLGLQPLEGAVSVAGSGRVRLSPLEVDELVVTARGELDAPLVGRLSDLDARLERRGSGPTTLLVDGALGAPFRIEGTLDPFDLRAVGRGVQLALPFLFIGGSTLDADLRARLDDGLQLSGTIDARELRIDLGARAAAGVGAADARSPAELAAQRAALELVVFDRVRLLAPQRVMLSETFGTAEAAFDLTLTGDAAAPRLEGSASALRGTLRFSGRDFELLRAEAAFEPTRGVLPSLAVEARSQFEKARALGAGSALRFVAPAGPRFEVTLAFDGDVVTDASGELTLDLVPRLASDALVETPPTTNGLTAGTRSLTELELLGLIAFGRLEPGGTGAFAGAVAQSALDTALDVLVVAELQAALSEAFGIDVVEIRTTALTDILGGGGDPFGVSLRLGGYLSDDLFASYRLGSFDDAERAFAFSQELMLTYDVGPVTFDVSGRLDFPSAAASQAVPGVSAAVRYDISRSVALEAGVDLRTERQTARLGVTLRW